MDFRVADFLQEEVKVVGGKPRQLESSNLIQGLAQIIN